MHIPFKIYDRLRGDRFADFASVGSHVIQVRIIQRLFGGFGHLLPPVCAISNRVGGPFIDGLTRLF